MKEINKNELLKENISNKKVTKAILSDIYTKDKKFKNLMTLSIDLGIVDNIIKEDILTKQNIYRFAKVLCDEYGTSQKDAMCVIYEWAEIFEIKCDDSSDELFLMAKEFLNTDLGSMCNWGEIREDVFNIISYAYVLADNDTRIKIVENSEQLWDEKNIKEVIIEKIMQIDEKDFLNNKVDSLFSSVYVIADKALKECNPEIINIKCFLNIHIIQLLVSAILYRDQKICMSLYLILLAALFYANKIKLEKTGFTDQSLKNGITSFPGFDEVISHMEECEEMTFCNLDVEKINEKSRRLFEHVKNGILNGELEKICANLSSL